MQGAEQVWLGGGIATMSPELGPYGAIADGAMVTGGGRILWVGPRAELPAAPGVATQRIDGWITPGLIDCHTHTVFGGNRAEEFEARLAGRTYEEIARAGGGIISTVTRTRAAGEAELLASASSRLAAMVAEGVTTIEIKSGYGLDLPTERRMLRVARALGPAHGVRVRTSFLGAHAVPPEFAGRGDAYVDALIGEILPALAAEGLVDAVDAFCERIAFSPDQVRRLFAAAAALGLPVKLHADQLSDGGGAALAAETGALSADHLEYTSPEGARAMAASGTVAVLLPGAYQMVGATQPPPVAAFRAEGVPMAVATDCNPGSSPLCSPLLAMNLACARFGLTPEEALSGFTRHAAQALGMQREIGRLAPGMRADFAVWHVGHPRELAYWMGGLKARARVTPAQWVGSSPAK